MSDVFTELAAASRHWAGDSPTGAMLSATRAFISAATADESLGREAAESLGHQAPGSAAWIAVSLGTRVERGASPDISGPAILALLRAWLPKLPVRGDDETPPEPSPAQKRLLAQFQYLCQSAVTHLARLPAMRQAMGGETPLIDRLAELGEYSHGAWWVREALLKTSGTLVLLHPPSATGLRLAYSNVSNCFHLFSLLQAAVGTGIPGGRAPRDGAPPTDAWWHYGSALSPKPDLSASIWGEGLVRDIPRVDGEQILLLWPPILEGRTWDAGFLGPHLEAMPASAVVDRMLAPEEARAWLERLGIARRRKRWWRF